MQLACQRHQSTPKTSPSLSTAQPLRSHTHIDPNPESSSPRRNRQQMLQATPVSTTVVDDVSLETCDLHSPSSQARLGLLPREPQGLLSCVCLIFWVQVEGDGYQWESCGIGMGCCEIGMENDFEVEVKTWMEEICVWVRRCYSEEIGVF